MGTSINKKYPPWGRLSATSIPVGKSIEERYPRWGSLPTNVVLHGETYG